MTDFKSDPASGSVRASAASTSPLAIFGSHVERVSLIHKLRSENHYNLPLYLVKKVLELVDQGVDADRHRRADSVVPATQR